MPALRDLVDALGPSVAHLAREGTPRELASLVIYDELADVRATPAGMLVAVGLQPSGARWQDLLAVASGFGCVAVKAYGLSDKDILGPAPDLGDVAIPMLVLADEVPWEQLIGLLSSAMTYAGPSGRDADGGRLGDLFTLANAVAAAVGGATAIADPATRLLAYSTVEGQLIDDTRRQSILDLHVPAGPEITAEYQAVHRAAGVIALPGRGADLARLAAPIRAGGELLGSMWVIDPGDEHRELARQRLGEAASIAALHLLRLRTERDGAKRRRWDLLTALLDESGAVESVARELALRAGPVRVVALVLTAPSVADPSTAVRQILEAVTLHCQGEAGFTAATAINDTVYVLLSVDAGLDRSRQLRLLAGLDAHIGRAHRYRLHIAVGDVVAEPTAAASSRRSADRVVTLMRLPSSARESMSARGLDVVFSDDVRAKIGLLQIAERCPIPDQATSATISAIADYDHANSSQYLPTLATYLRCFGDIANTARALHVHVNTCRYRLNRIRDLFGIDLTDSDGRLVLALQLRLSELLA